MYIFEGKNELYDHEYLKEIQKVLQDDGEESKLDDGKITFSLTFYRFLQETGMLEIFEIINFALTFVLILFYIISTYTYPEDSTFKEKTNSAIDSIEFYILLILFIHFIIKFYVSQSRFLFMFEYVTIVDYSTIICIFIANLSFPSEDFQYFLRMFRMIRILYLLKIEALLQKKFNETVRYSYKLGINFCALIFISTSLILEIENRNTRIQKKSSSSGTNQIKGRSELNRFHDMLYFEVVSMVYNK